MGDLKLLIIKELQQNKHFSESTLLTYANLISALYVKLGGTKTCRGFFRENSEQATILVDSKEQNQTKKVSYSALFALTGMDIYHQKMIALGSKIKEKYNKQEKKEHLPTFQEIKNIHDLYMREFEKNETVFNATNVLVTGLMSGVYPCCPPRRLLDYSELKRSEFDTECDNFLDNGQMVFNKYKTAKADKEKGLLSSTEFPSELQRPLKLITGEFVLTRKSGLKFSPQALGKRLVWIYGFSVDDLRSIFLSEMYKDLPKLVTMNEIASKMGHSVNAALSYYVKK
jgi:hypothetical protein